VFAVKWGEVGRRADVNYNHPAYTNLVEKLSGIFGSSLKTIGDIADVICGPFGTAITNSDYTESGIPLLRITNIGKQGHLDYTDLKYITQECADSLSRTQVSQGDVVITQRGTLGQCAVVDNRYNVCNISANLIAVKNISEVNAEFVRNYILSPIGVALLQRMQSGQVQGKITTQDISELPIPVVSDVNKLNSVIAAGYATFSEKLRQADDVVEQSKDAMFAELGVDFPELKPQTYIYSRLGDIRSGEIFCNKNVGFAEKLFDLLRESKHYVGELKGFINVNPRTDVSTLTDNSVITFIPMPAVEAKNNQVEYATEEYRRVKTGYTVFKRGDLLWAKITPCMQNGKSCLVTGLPTEIGFGSTEFHIMRAKSDKVYMPFIWALFSNEHVLQSAQAMFNGSAGQQRVTDRFLREFPLILPELSVQKTLADKVFTALDTARALRAEAETEWAAAKARFERELLAGGDE
jgi:type I restriction enzyme S subunit